MTVEVLVVRAKGVDRCVRVKEVSAQGIFSASKINSKPVQFAQTARYETRAKGWIVTKWRKIETRSAGSVGAIVSLAASLYK